ncbi:Kinesin-like protein [Drosera capensis]
MTSIALQRIRVVAKIRDLTKPDAKRGPNSWVSVHRPEEGSSGRVKVEFKDLANGGKQQSCEVDGCYGGEDGGGNGAVFEKEIRPLIGKVFEGRNVTVFAYGAKGSGKTFTIQGTEEEPGLAEKAVNEILNRAEDVGRSVSISLFEVHLEHVVDLLDPKRPDVSVFEDAHGKIRIKGLSEVNVKSVEEFMNLYLSGVNARRPLQKIANKPNRRSHRGLIVHVFPSLDEVRGGLVSGKMNFVDLAGYENPRKKDSNGSGLFEITRNNKSLYAIQNVVHALNASWIYVPYRESKLTRLLQDSLGCRSHILMITCMNQCFCEDAIKALSLASRSCQASNPTNTDLAKKVKGMTRPTFMSSIKSMKSAISSVSFKKQARPLSHISKAETKSVIIEPTRRGLFQVENHLETSQQVLFQDENQLETSEQETSIIVLEDQTSQIMRVEERNSALDGIFQEEPSQSGPTEEETSIIVPEDQTSQIMGVEEKNSALNDIFHEPPSQSGPTEEDHISEIKEDHVRPTPITYHTPIAGLNKDNRSLAFDEDGSPPLSARLRKLSNTLKSLCTATKLKLPTTCEEEFSLHHDESSHESLQPITPSIDTSLDLATPQEKFHSCNSRLKNSFVQSHLKFLNTANKEELKQLKGIGEKRAAYIVELRNRSPEPFKNLEDLESIGLSAKQNQNSTSSSSSSSTVIVFRRRPLLRLRRLTALSPSLIQAAVDSPIGS